MVIGDILRATASRDPNKTGVVFGEKRFNWAEVNTRVNRLANGLLALGLQKGDRVAILSRACNEYMEFNLAAAKAGLVQVALNHWSLGKELLHPINDSGARALLVHSEFAQRVRDIRSELDTVRHIVGIAAGHNFEDDFDTIVARSPMQEPTTPVDEADLYCLCYTSGTTGKPKGVMFTHRAVVRGAFTLALESQISRTDVFLMVIPFCFASHQTSRFHAVLLGATCIILNFDALAALQTIQKEGASYLHIGPAALQMLLDHPRFQDHDLSSLRRVWITGGALPPALWDRVDGALGPVAAPTLGMTENGSCEVWFDRRELATANPERTEILRSSVGKQIPGVQIRVVREDGREVAHDGEEVGEILTRGDTTMTGYWNLPQETAKAIKDGWLHTGDMVTIDSEGYVFFKDRKREMIKSGGMMVYPLEIEELLKSHPAVQHCAVIGVPHERWGESPKAFVMLRPGMAVTVEELLELCRKNMASYKKPSAIEIVDSLPFTVSGKISKAELRRQQGGVHPTA